MTKGDPVPVIPENTPKTGEIYRHYKGDLYKIVALALHSTDNEYTVVYEALYPNPAAKLFTRPLKVWSEVVEWEGKKVQRFTKQ